MFTNDVEHLLLQSRSFRRRPGDVPYPVQHIGAACSAFDAWNNMFRTRSQSLTLHKFESPPPVVLDLGCGNGYWAIEAAKTWPNSVVVGFDVKDIQPKLLHTLAWKHHFDIAHRVKWVHGNLLDGLPFPSSYFDFVRVVNIGLGVPEDEWQYVFEEAARVLRPGGVIEVIEEDPIFPCEIRRPLWGASHGNSSMTLVNRSPSIVIPSNPPLAHGSPAISCVTLHERCEPNSPTSPNNLSSPTIALPPHPFPRKSSAPSCPTSHPYLLSPHDTPNIPYRPSTPQTETDRTSDLQDHSRLKAAWDAMLASRFIAESTLSVLPFYLSSTFPDVQSIAPVKVLLPPNSRTKQSPSNRSSSEPSKSAKSRSPPSLVRTVSESTCSSGWDTATLAPLSRTSSSNFIDSYTTEFAQMHLASTVHTVAGCKEAIWQEYKKLYDVNVAKIVSPNADALSGHTASSGPGNDKSSIRESFDDEWAAWYNDMTDRIGMRALMAQLDWAEPPGQRPDWHLWRNKVQQSSENKGSSGSCEFARNPPALCRSMRGFIGRKPRLN